jgi:predicted methyltransferase
MKSVRGMVLVSIGVLIGCGGESPPPAAPAPAAPTAVASAPSAAPAAAAEPTPPPAEPTAEEKKKAEALHALEQDRAKWREENTAELARWTPELHASAKALADKLYGSGRAAIRAAMAGTHRKPGNSDRDKARHPDETLAFFGLKPTLTVLEIDPGEGWYTELLAPALAAQGKLIATTSDPAGPEDQRSTFYGKRFKAFLDKAPEIYGKVQPLVVDDKAPLLGPDGSVDMVLLMRAAHGMINNGTLSAWLGAVAKVLKKGGVLGIEQHRAPVGADPLASAKNGYVPEKWLIEQCEAAGFKVVRKSEINANAKDTKDYPEGVWALPPTLRLGDKDRAKYVAIGESDRMTLKLVKAN